MNVSEKMVIKDEKNDQDGKGRTKHSEHQTRFKEIEKRLISCKFSQERFSLARWCLSLRENSPFDHVQTRG